MGFTLPYLLLRHPILENAIKVIGEDAPFSTWRMHDSSWRDHESR